MDDCLETSEPPRYGKLIYVHTCLFTAEIKRVIYWTTTMQFSTKNLTVPSNTR